MAAPAKIPQDFLPGDVLCGQWRLETIIGKGGMGSVWEATELKFGRKVAVKTLHPNLLQDEAVRRFEREAQVMAKLDHPHVVTLLAFARQDGLPFIVMRHLKGANLRAVINENGGRLSWKQLGPLMRQLCDALDYIHSRGVVHRDLKLSNIFLDKDGWLTLLDMGLARGHRSTITHTGMVWGTPHFLSPEQVAGQKVIDGRSDLYGLGAVTYLVLSGRYPFESSDDQALLRSHLNAPRPDITRIAPHVPPAVSLVLQKAMAVAPEERYQKATDFFVALDEAFATGGATRISELVTPSQVATVSNVESATEPAMQRPTNPRPSAPRPSSPRLRPTVTDRAPMAATLEDPERETPQRPTGAGGETLVPTTTPERPPVLPQPSAPPPPPPAPVAARWSIHPVTAGAAAVLVLAIGFFLGRCA